MEVPPRLGEEIVLMTSKEVPTATAPKEGVQEDAEEAVNQEEATGSEEHSSVVEEWSTGTTLPLNSKRLNL